MDSKTLQLIPRTELGKGAAKKIRKEGKIPAVIYGHQDPVSISIDAREFEKKFHTVSENTIITLQGENSSYDVLVKEYQDDIISEKILHIDFFEIEKGKALRTHVPVHTTGNSIGVREGGVLDVVLHDLEIECLPKDLPQEILVDISELGVNDTVHVSDLKAPEGVKILTAADTSVLSISTASTQLETETAEDVEEGAEADAPAVEDSEAE